MLLFVNNRQFWVVFVDFVEFSSRFTVCEQKIHLDISNNFWMSHQIFSKKKFIGSGIKFWNKQTFIWASSLFLWFSRRFANKKSTCTHFFELAYFPMFQNVVRWLIRRVSSKIGFLECRNSITTLNTLMSAKKSLLRRKTPHISTPWL